MICLDLLLHETQCFESEIYEPSTELTFLILCWNYSLSISDVIEGLEGQTRDGIEVWWAEDSKRTGVHPCKTERKAI